MTALIIKTITINKCSGADSASMPSMRNRTLQQKCNYSGRLSSILTKLLFATPIRSTLYTHLDWSEIYLASSYRFQLYLLILHVLAMY